MSYQLLADAILVLHFVIVLFVVGGLVVVVAGPRVSKQDGRNFGYGRQFSHAGPQALRELFGAGRYATVKMHAERCQMFVQWCRSPPGPSINDARLIDRPLCKEQTFPLIECSPELSPMRLP
jgi:hypothetical protein